MKKRLFFKFILYSGLIVFMYPFFSYAGFVELKNRIRNRFKKPVTLPPDSERSVTKLPHGGLDISVETALNSRCTSDYDDAQELAHWGLFNKEEKLSENQINMIANRIKIPALSKHQAAVLIKGNEFIFSYDNTAKGLERNWLMIESGMQQQAVCLLCAAFGIGMVFKALGKEGKPLSDKEYTMLKIKPDAMKPSYGNSYWTSRPPKGIRPWLDGNLKTPDRTGKLPLVTALSNLSLQTKGDAALTHDNLGQLLWAARGRTPHLYKSQAWGMTIPTSRGEQNNTRIDVFTKDWVSLYVNWSGNQPTHALKKNGRINHNHYVGFCKTVPHKNHSLMISGINRSAKICMEAGYQLLNILLQAKSLNLSYTTHLLNDHQINLLKNTGIENPIALVCFQ